MSTDDKRARPPRGRRLKDTSKTGPNRSQGLERGPKEPRHWYSVDPVAGCWNWKGVLSETGYATTRYNGRYVGAHRAYYAHYVEPIPPHRVVMHTCDNPACVNPEHLRLGTQGENIADRNAKGRGKGWVYDQGPGSERANAKLDEAKVIEIRARAAAGEMFKDLAAEFGVSGTTISVVVNRKAWTHV